MNMANEPTNQEQPKKKSKLKLIIILLILLLLILGGVATYWWLNLRVPEPVNTEIPQQTQTAEAPAEKPKEENSLVENVKNLREQIAPTKTLLNIVTIPTVTINLADKDSIRYLKVGFDIELSTKDAAEALEDQKARIRDSIIILLSSKTYSELSTTEGKLKVKNEISTRLNQILGVPRVVQIYFNEFVIN
ncbi:MAG TPA: hypothetical protein DEB43_08250 [Desulfovibrio sp.]|nr:hypothetical protein [Desulfovibrio sp.]